MKKRILSLLAVLALLGALIPAALAAAPGEVYAASNGDGYTPFNLQWKDKGRGIASFDKQTTGSYRVTIYRDGISVGGATVGNREMTEEVNLSDDMTQSGTYVFTVNDCSPPSTAPSKGKIARSDPFAYTAPSAVLGAPTNLRFEASGGKVTCLWDAPANWVDGRDFFQVDVSNSTTGWGNRSISILSTRYDISFENFIAPQYGGPTTDAGTYTFSVRAISGDITAIRSAGDFTKGTATYSHPDGAIKNPTGGTTPVTPPTPAAPMAYMRTQSITIDGKAVSFQAYALKDAKGNETNYVKLRDVAGALNGTSVQFNVGWNGSVNIEKGKAYVPNGTEMQTPFTGDRPYQNATAATNVNGAKSSLTAIVLTDDKGAGYTYYKLRDLGDALGFKVNWSADKGISVDTGATPAAPPAADSKYLSYLCGAKITNLKGEQLRRDLGWRMGEFYQITFDLVAPIPDTITLSVKRYDLGKAPTSLDGAKKEAAEMVAAYQQNNQIFDNLESSSHVVDTPDAASYRKPVDTLFVTLNRSYEVLDYVVIRSNEMISTDGPIRVLD